MILTRWANLKGHDRCWHHTEVLQELCGIFGIPTDNDPCLPPQPEFEEGCRKYQQLMYGGVAKQADAPLLDSGGNSKNRIGATPFAPIQNNRKWTVEVFLKDGSSGFLRFPNYPSPSPVEVVKDIKDATQIDESRRDMHYEAYKRDLDAKGEKFHGAIEMPVNDTGKIKS